MPETEAALELLMKPDPYSRTKAKTAGGWKPIEGGWLVVNGEKYDRLFKEQRDAELNRARVNRFRQPNGDDGGAPHNGNGTVSAPPEESKSNARGTLAELVEFVVSLGLPASDGEHIFHRWEGKRMDEQQAADSELAGPLFGHGRPTATCPARRLPLHWPSGRPTPI